MLYISVNTLENSCISKVKAYFHPQLLQIIPAFLWGLH